MSFVCFVAVGRLVADNLLFLLRRLVVSRSPESHPITRQAVVHILTPSFADSVLHFG